MKYTKVLLTGTLILLHSLATNAQVEKYLAAFTYQICKLTTWPDVSGDFVIGIVGNSHVTTYLEQMANTKKMDNSRITLKVCTNTQGISGCNVLFVGKDQTAQLQAIVNTLANQPVLIITEADGMVKKGAGFSFCLVDNKIRFSLNKTELEKRNLKIKSELERMALRVY